MYHTTSWIVQDYLQALLRASTLRNQFLILVGLLSDHVFL
jgi:hypothetical protein